MGTGKTQVGRRVAQRLHLAFLDMDEEIERREGRKIGEIFARDGEPYFRTLERRLVQELAAQAGRVIAAGGGVVLNPDNLADFATSGLVVCLRARPETLLQRLASDTSRPLLAGEDKTARIRELLQRRQPLYDAIPHQVKTDDLTVDEVADAVLALYNAFCSGSRSTS